MMYVLGVDGGNTKTDYMLFNTDGQLIKHERRGTISHEALPNAFEDTRVVFKAHIDELFDGLTKPKYVTAAFGLAGLDMPFQGRILGGIIRDIGFECFEAANDGVLGIKAAAPNGYGVCSINGTGTVAAGIDKHNKYRQVGGVSPFCDYEGGGGTLALKTARCVYDELLRFGKKTAMTERLLKLLNVTDKHEYQEIFLKHYCKEIKDWQVSDILLDCAIEGDTVAIETLEYAGREMARSAAGCAKELDFDDEDIDVIFAGSMWIKPKTPLMKDAFMREFDRLNGGKANFISLNMPPASGAVLWALELANGEYPRGVLKEKVMEQLRQIKM